MSALYRAVLKCYPRWWRDQHGEEALGLLLDSAEARGRADFRDLLNLAAHAARLRLTQAGPPTLVQGIRNRVSVIAVALLAAISSTFLVFGEWAPWDPQSSMEGSPIGNVTTGSIPYLAGLLAALAMILGRAVSARWLAAFSALSALAIMAPPIEQFAHSFGFTRPPGGVLAFVVMVAALAATGEPVPPRSSSRGLFALLTAGPTIAAILVLASSLGPEPWFFYRLPDQVSLRIALGILLGTGLIVLAAVLLIAGHRTWGTALAVNSAPWLLLFALDPTVRGVGAAPISGPSLLALVVAAALLTGLLVIRRQASKPTDTPSQSIAPK
ncbi:hypothetical protein [Kribbella speibonae]|uniref:Uncharacterized protein n=1 Tax=Kribbella speibonae TaxID=1572660 RepID=A0A4V2M3S3_9ACTN|nr:hypothetical protein [Kribbella speibonae]TCC33152.1 hypothetical protein E0H92_33940 [Kribbella speibonae]